MAAVELIVIDVETVSSEMPSNSFRISATDAMENTYRPTSPAASG